MKWVSSADWNTRVLPALSAFNVRKVVLANKVLMRILRTRVLLLVKTSALVALTGFSMLKRPRKIKQKIRTIWGVALWQQGLASQCKQMKQMWVCGTALMFWVSGDWEHKTVCNLLVTSCLWLLKPYTDFSKGSPVQCKQNTTKTVPKHGASVESNGWHLRVVLLNWECASLPRRIRHVCSFGLLIADWQNVRLS